MAENPRWIEPPDVLPGVPMPRPGDHLIVQSVVMHNRTRDIYIVVKMYQGAFVPPVRMVMRYNYWNHGWGLLLPPVIE
jgi:hypothetical protein